MRLLSLTYHDIAPLREQERTGFTDAGAARYKLTPELFSAHLEMLAGAALTPVLVDDASSCTDRALLLTFDDAGVSAVNEIAPQLAGRGWHAHFFVPTALVGASGFMNRGALRELAAAGHVVGSHGHTHRPLTRLTDAALDDELRTSKALLEDVVEGEVASLSIPRGFYSARIARLAAENGFRYVFTSEPWLRARTLHGVEVLGRFAVVSGTRPERIAALASFSRRAILREAMGWQARKTAKVVLGPVYPRLRERLLARRGTA